MSNDSASILRCLGHSDFCSVLAILAIIRCSEERRILESVTLLRAYSAFLSEWHFLNGERIVQLASIRPWTQATEPDNDSAGGPSGFFFPLPSPRTC